MRETKIDPALSVEQWAEIRRMNDITVVSARGGSATVSSDSGGLRVDTETDWGALAVPLPVAIALANDGYPDSDRRKITREIVNRLRETAYNAPDGYSGPTWLADLADALESYLPPEGL